MRSNWLYFATVLDVRSDPTLIWPAEAPTARSAMNASSVSPDRADTIAETRFRSRPGEFEGDQDGPRR